MDDYVNNFIHYRMSLIYKNARNILLYQEVHLLFNLQG